MSIRTTASVGNVLADQLVIDMQRKVFYLEPTVNPLLKILNMSKNSRKVVKNPKFNHLEGSRIGTSTNINSALGHNTTVAVIQVDDGTIFNADDLAKNVRTGEQFLVTAVSTNTLTVTREFGETSRAAMVDNDEIIRLGSAYTDGDGANDPRMKKLTTDYNYIQCFRTEYGADYTLQASEQYSGPELTRQRFEHGMEHSIEIEQQFLFGERYGVNLTGNNPRRTTRGLIKWISTNTHDAGGPLTEDEFEQEFLEDGFRYGKKTKYFLAASRVISVIDGWGRDKLRYDTETSSKLGLKVMEYNTTHGELKIVKHDLLDGDTYGGYGILIDPSNIFYAYMQGLDTRINRSIQTPGMHVDKEEYATYCGLGVVSEQTHALLTGVTR